MDRRRFLKTTGQCAIASTLAAAAGRMCLAGAPATNSGPVPGPQPGYALPDHLPKRLSIGMFIWNWVTMATPGEPYHDLEKAVAGLPERGFNAVRVEAGLNWCFRMDGQPRGEMEFGPWIAGYRDNLTSANDRGGGRHDVLKRVTRLMELAKQHGVYVILTSWEYQDSSWLVADPKIRAEVMAVPEEKRLMHMARQHDRLLRRLERQGTPSRTSPSSRSTTSPTPACSPKGTRARGCTKRRLPSCAMPTLTSWSAATIAATTRPSCPTTSRSTTSTPTCGTVHWRRSIGQTIWHKDFDPANPRKLKLLDRLLKDKIVPYAEFIKAAQNVRGFWRGIDWLYYNLDNERFDQWILEEYTRREAGLKAAGGARYSRATPARPRAGRSRRSATRAATSIRRWDRSSSFARRAPSMFELQVDLAIKHGYWGMMPTTYCGAGASDLGQRRVAASHQWPVPVGKVAGVEDTRIRRRDGPLQQQEIFHAQGSLIGLTVTFLWTDADLPAASGCRRSAQPRTIPRWTSRSETPIGCCRSRRRASPR